LTRGARLLLPETIVPRGPRADGRLRGFLLRVVPESAGFNGARLRSGNYHEGDLLTGRPSPWIMNEL
jgi:hypothetical protein